MADAKDLEIARLKGQIEAYQSQCRSMAIELLRKQVADLQQAERDREQAIKSLHAAFGKFQTEVEARITKASTLFAELRDQVKNGAADA